MFFNLSFKIRFTYTLGARGFSCAVSGFGYTASPLASLASRPAADEAPHRTREKPPVPSVLHLKHGGRRVFS